MTRRAISPAIASIFLIGVAVVGSISAGNAMFKQIDTAQKLAKLDVVSASLVRPDGSNGAYFVGTVRNTGTITFSSATISFVDDLDVSHTITLPSSMAPGEQQSGYLMENAAVIPGNRYLINVEGVTVSGSTYRTADTILAK